MQSITLYLRVGSYFEEVKFLEIRMKITLQDTLINEDNPGTTENSFFMQEFWKQHFFSKGTTWGPSDETRISFQFNSTIIQDLGSNPAGYKMIFELWEWSFSSESFTYSGIFVYLTSFQLVLIS